MIMKNFIKTTLLVLALMLPATATAHDFEADGIYYKIAGTGVIVRPSTDAAVS